ncbi:unnamed protein product [Staurois parvus]|uniref:Uncharacterized protein n=1 Tax=Staurois parvus TaxID=386267 RepID=A0ABN9GKU3_9NEOB|nr:unnamed protein product [Staurois parvus]
MRIHTGERSHTRVPSAGNVLTANRLLANTKLSTRGTSPIPVPCAENVFRRNRIF